MEIDQQDVQRYMPERSGLEKTIALELVSKDTEIVPETTPLLTSIPIPASVSHDHSAHSLSKSPYIAEGTLDLIQIQMEQLQENLFTLMLS